MNLDPTLPRLACVKPPPEERVNCTVRLGPRWMEHYLKGETRIVLLLTEGGELISNADIAACYYVPLGDVKPGWLARCIDMTYPRTINKLLGDLEKAYDEEINLSSMVSVVFFQVRPLTVEPVTADLPFTQVKGKVHHG